MKKNIKISLIEPNNGQIDGVPANPRFIRDEKFEKLVKSILDDPEMLEHRGQMVYPFKAKYVAIGGNMRLRAIHEVIDMPTVDFDAVVESKRDTPDFLSWFSAIMLLRDKKEVPCEVLDKDTSAEKLRAFAIKDNLGYGDWDHDMLANEWDMDELLDWGLDLPQMVIGEDVEEEVEGEIAIPEAKLTVEHDDPQKLEALYAELEGRGFKCVLSK